MTEPMLLARYIGMMSKYIHDEHVRGMSEYGFSHPHVGFLLMLHHHGGINQTELTHGSGRDKTTVARTIRRLVDDGYIVRERDPDDQRNYVIQLTERGEEAVPRILEEEARIESRLLEGLDEREVEALERTLRAMVRNIWSDVHGDRPMPPFLR